MSAVRVCVCVHLSYTQLLFTIYREDVEYVNAC